MCEELGTVTGAIAGSSCGPNSGELLRNCLDSNEDEIQIVVFSDL